MSLSGSDSSVTASTVAECGKSGISTSGANFDTLQPQNLSIVGNYVANTSRIVRTYQPGIGFSTVGCYYANNTIYNSPHTAMQVSIVHPVVQTTSSQCCCVLVDPLCSVVAA